MSLKSQCDDRFDIVGQSKVFCHCSMTYFLRNSQSKEEQSQEEQKADELEGEMEEVKHSWIRVQLIKNGQLIHPITQRDDLLFVLNEKIHWKGFGVRRFLDDKWTLTDETTPTLSKRIGTANAMYSGHQYRLTITVIINGDDNEQLTEHYHPDITNEIENVLNRSLSQIKQTVGDHGENLVYSELLYSEKEKKLENSVAQVC